MHITLAGSAAAPLDPAYADISARRCALAWLWFAGSAAAPLDPAYAKFFVLL